MATDPKDSPVGQWGTVSYAVPVGIKTVTDPVGNVLEVAVQSLQIAVDALTIAEAYTVGFLNPVAAASKLVADEIHKMSKDIGGIGLYLTGDWHLVKPPFKDLLGGYAEYERRMVGRLTDRSDPTRPMASSSSTVVAFFFYAQQDTAAVRKMVKLLLSLTRFFNLSFVPPSVLPSVSPIGVQYGLAGGGWRSISEALSTPSKTPPNIARIRWTAKSPQGGSPPISLPTPPPGGFAVCVSVLPEGIGLAYDRPLGSGTVSAKGNKRAQRRDAGKVRDAYGVPIVLHGGADWVSADAMTWNASIDAAGNVKDNTARVYGLKAGAEDHPIPLEALIATGDDGKPVYLLQRTFWVSTLASWTDWASGTFSKEIKHEDLPELADVVVGADGKVSLVRKGKTSTFYVRIAAVDGDAATKHPFYDLPSLGNTIFSGRPVVAQMGNGLDPSSIGPFSKPLTVTFPNAYTAQYLEVVQTALILLVLARVDLPLLDDLGLDPDMVTAIRKGKMPWNDVALLPTGLEHLRFLVTLMFSDIRSRLKNFTNPEDFRVALRDAARRVANELYQMTGPMPALEEKVVAATKQLREATWGDFLGGVGAPSLTLQGFASGLTILGSVQPGAPSDFGIAASPRGLGIADPAVETLFATPGAIGGRAPHFGRSWPNTIKPVLSAKAEDVPKLLAEAPPGLRMMYRTCIQADGSMVLDTERAQYAKDQAAQAHEVGTADLSPIVFGDRSAIANLSSSGVLEGGPLAVYARTALASYNAGELFREASLVLGVAASAMGRPNADGQWISLRLRDAVPAIDDVLKILDNWVQAVQESIKSASDALRDYIEFVKARIAELQGLIQRINSLIHMLDSLALSLPQVAGLVLVSQGTDALVTDLVSAKAKPVSNPLAYGAGAVLVVTTPAPTFLLELFKPKSSTPLPTAALGAPITIEGQIAPVDGSEDDPL